MSARQQHVTCHGTTARSAGDEEGELREVQEGTGVGKGGGQPKLKIKNKNLCLSKSFH